MKPLRHACLRLASASLATLIGCGATIAFASLAPAAGPTTSVVPAATSPTRPGDDTKVKPEDVVTVESFSVGPSGSLDPTKPGDRVNFSYDAAPGTVIHDSAIVYNFGNIPLPFHVFATDAFNASDGNLTLLPTEKAPTDVGSWAVFNQSEVTVPPLKEAVIPFTITVPASARPGDHIGGVVASSPVEGQNQTGQRITFDRRVGSKLYLRVNGKFHPELAITRLETDYSYSASPTDGRAKVKFRVENRGDVRLGGTPIVEVSGPLGLGKRTIKLPALKDLVPGGAAYLTTDVPKVGSWFTMRTTVKLKPEGTTDLGVIRAAQGSTLSFTPPISVLAILAVVILVTMLWRRAKKRRQEEEELLATPGRVESTMAESVSQ